VTAALIRTMAAARRSGNLLYSCIIGAWNTAFFGTMRHRSASGKHRRYAGSALLQFRSEIEISGWRPYATRMSAAGDTLRMAACTVASSCLAPSHPCESSTRNMGARSDPAAGGTWAPATTLAAGAGAATVSASSPKKPGPSCHVSSPRCICQLPPSRPCTVPASAAWRRA